MAKLINHGALDAAFGYIADRADTLALVSGVPASAVEAVTPADEGGRMLGLADLAPGLGNGDFSVAAGAVSGRRLVVAGRDGVAVMAAGVADHLALVASATDEVLVVTALAESLELAAGDSVSVRGFSDEIADPV